MLYYVEQKDGAWLVPENIGQTVIETVPGQPFEVNFQDLNVDGKIFFVEQFLLRYWQPGHHAVDTAYIAANFTKVNSNEKGLKYVYRSLL